MKLIQLLKEIKVNKPNILYSFTKMEGGDVVFDWDNIIKNAKKFKNQISKKLNIPLGDKLDLYIIYYINQLQEMEHQGEESVYEDFTLNDFLDDLEGVSDNVDDNDILPDPSFDIFTTNDIQ